MDIQQQQDGSYILDDGKVIVDLHQGDFDAYHMVYMGKVSLADGTTQDANWWVNSDKSLVINLID